MKGSGRGSVDTFGSRSTAIDDSLREASDYGLLVLGEIVRETIYGLIAKDHGLKRTDIPEQLEAFHKALESVLGANVKTVERLIAKNLYERLNLNFTPRPEWTLVEYVDHAKTTPNRKPTQVHE